MHQHFQAAYDYSREVVERALAGERQIAFLLGATRSGKTLVSDLLLEDFPQQTLQGQQSFPVIRVPTPTRPTKKAMAEAILGQLDSRRYGRYSTDQATTRAVYLLRAAQVRVVLFDEVQHIVERNTSKSWYEIADWLKALSDELQLSLLLVGLPMAREIIEVNHQLRDRAAPPHILFPYNWNRPEDIAEFCRCLLSISQVLAAQGYQVPDMANLDLVRRCYASSVGRYGMVVKLFEEARHRAGTSRSITLSTLFEAHRLSIATNATAENPFAPDADLPDSVLVQRYVALLNESGLSVTDRSSKAALPMKTAPLTGRAAGARGAQ